MSEHTSGILIDCDMTADIHAFLTGLGFTDVHRRGMVDSNR
jgi:hypothetical protein